MKFKTPKSKKVLCIASNYGLWGEELQAPWDALKKAGHQLTLATPLGKKPLPMTFSMDPEFIDPVQNYHVNPKEMVNRIIEILEKTGEWDNPIKIADANMDDYDALVLVGGPGSAIDMTGNPLIHNLVLKAYKANKVIGALCYVVGCLSFTRDPDNGNKSVIYGKSVTAHPHEWDFTGELPYPLYKPTPDNKGTDCVTTGFVFPLQFMVTDAVGPNGTVISDPTANRVKPCVAYDHPFVTGLSAESSIAYGDKLVEVLKLV